MTRQRKEFLQDIIGLMIVGILLYFAYITFLKG